MRRSARPASAGVLVTTGPEGDRATEAPAQRVRVGSGSRNGCSGWMVMRRPPPVGHRQLPLGALSRSRVDSGRATEVAHPADDRLLHTQRPRRPTPPGVRPGCPARRPARRRPSGRPAPPAAPRPRHPARHGAHVAQARLHRSDDLGSCPGRQRHRGAGDSDVHRAGLQGDEPLRQVLRGQRSAAGSRESCWTRERSRTSCSPGQPPELDPSGPSSGARRCTRASACSTPSWTTRASRCPFGCSGGRPLGEVALGGRLLQQTGQEAHDRAAEDAAGRCCRRPSA